MLNVPHNETTPDILVNTFLITPLFLVVWIIVLINRKHTSKLTIARFLLDFPFMLYLYLLLDKTIFPVNVFLHGNWLRLIRSVGIGQQFFIQLNPLDVFSYGFNYYGLLNLFGNIALFAPLVFFWMLYHPKLTTLKSALLIAFICSLIIETTQLILNVFYLGNRLWDIDDLILNTLGGIIGFLLIKFVMHFFPSVFAAFKKQRN